MAIKLHCGSTTDWYKGLWLSFTLYARAPQIFLNCDPFNQNEVPSPILLPRPSSQDLNAHPSSTAYLRLEIIFHAVRPFTTFGSFSSEQNVFYILVTFSSPECLFK